MAGSDTIRYRLRSNEDDVVRRLAAARHAHRLGDRQRGHLPRLSWIADLPAPGVGDEAEVGRELAAIVFGHRGNRGGIPGDERARLHVGAKDRQLGDEPRLRRGESGAALDQAIERGLRRLQIVGGPLQRIGLDDAAGGIEHRGQRHAGNQRDGDQHARLETAVPGDERVAAQTRRPWRRPLLASHRRTVHVRPASSTFVRPAARPDRLVDDVDLPLRHDPKRTRPPAVNRWRYSDRAAVFAV